MPTTHLPPFNREAEISALKRAIVVERRARFADFQGRRMTFSKFMCQTADKLCKRFPMDAKWATIRGLFRQYPNTDVATRISILHRVEELLTTADNDLQTQRSNALSPKPAITVASTALTGTQTKEAVVSEQIKESYQGEVDPPLKGSVSQAGHETGAARGHVSVSEKKSPSAPNLDAKSSRPSIFKEHKEQPTASVSNEPIDAIDVQFVKGVGPKLATVLANLNIGTVEQLIRHYPRRHLDFQNRLMIRDLKIGQDATIIGTIKSIGAFQSKNRNISLVTVVINDGTGSISVVRFIGGKSNKFLLDRYKDQFPKGAQVLASGTVQADNFRSRMQLKNAEIEILGLGVEDGQEYSSLHTGRLVPVYPLTEGLSLRHLRSIIYNALDSYGEKIEDLLPADIASAHQLIDLRSALYAIHFPDDPEVKDEAQRRLIFDELFNIQLQLAYRRHHADVTESGLALNPATGNLIEQFRKVLPFKLTGAQERVFAEISRDLASSKPMHRLVQGDVGSGKTVVALMSFLVAVANGYQGAMMAPTEILAEQHYRQFQQLLTPLGLRCALLLGKQGQKERRAILQDLLSGQVHLAVGTHALISEGVEFKNLGLIIIDEQHRFGVKQRARLKAKGQNPELLTMTATPIPRTLALTMHGDLDVSEIDELPPGRKPITTKLFTAGDKGQLHGFIRGEVLKGRQVYIVFPLIDESETLAAKAATAEYEKLRTTVFPELTIGLMHGKLKSQEKDEVMEQFRAGQFQILVSTTVIEVGVDVPNASVMVIENADRFGLAQLHQLRGRVGRGSEQSYCFLVSDNRSESTRQRLEILCQTNDGFVVAEKDLELRGPGEFLGTRQSGLPDLCLADLVRDAKTLEEARLAAIDLIKKDPDLLHHPRLLKKVQLRLTSQEADLIGSG